MQHCAFLSILKKYPRESLSCENPFVVFVLISQIDLFCFVLLLISISTFWAFLSSSISVLPIKSSPLKDIRAKKKKTMMENFLVRSQYEYEDTNDEKVLKFGSDEFFVLIKDSDATDWFYVLNQNGQIGYVPNSYVTFEKVCSLLLCCQLFSDLFICLPNRIFRQNKCWRSSTR